MPNRRVCDVGIYGLDLFILKGINKVNRISKDILTNAVHDISIGENKKRRRVVALICKTRVM